MVALCRYTFARTITAAITLAAGGRTTAMIAAAAAAHGLDGDAVIIVARRSPHGFGKTVGDPARDIELGIVRANLDRANLVFGDVPAATQQRQDPARIGILPPPDVEPEVDAEPEA